MNCTECGDPEVILQGLCPECFNEQEYRKIEREESRRLVDTRFPQQDD